MFTQEDRYKNEIVIIGIHVNIFIINIFVLLLIPIFVSAHNDDVLTTPLSGQFADVDSIDISILSLIDRVDNLVNKEESLDSDTTHPNKIKTYCSFFKQLYNAKEYDKAILYAKKILDDSFYKENINYLMLYVLAILYYQDVQDLSNAKFYFTKWDKLSTSYKPAFETAEEYFDKRETLSTFYLKIGDDASALSSEFFTMSKMKETIGVDNFYYALSLNNIANAYAGIGNKEKAIQYAEDSYILRTRLLKDGLIDSMTVARAAHNMSIHYNSKNLLNDALKYMKNAISLSDSISDVRFFAYIGIADLYVKIGEQDSSEMALGYATRTLENLKRNDHKDYWQEEYLVLKRYADNMRRNGYLQKAIKTYDLIINIMERKHISNIEKPVGGIKSVHT